MAFVVGVAVTVDVLRGGVLTDLDHNVSAAMRSWGVRFDPWPMRLTYLLTLPGQRGTVLILTGPTVAYLVWRGRTLAPLVRWIVALVLLTASVYALKLATGRLAPPVDGLHTATGASFPSGHVANAIIVWGSVAFSAAVLGTTPPWLAQVLRGAVVVAPVCVVIGMTILDYHWSSDFAAGICLGLVVLRLVVLDVWTRPLPPWDRRLGRVLPTR